MEAERGQRQRQREGEEVITAEDKIVWPFLNPRNAFEARERQTPRRRHRMRRKETGSEREMKAETVFSQESFIRRADDE